MPKGHAPNAHQPTRHARFAPPTASSVAFDDPEDEEWFQRLPEAAKADLRRRWAEGETRGVRRVAFRKMTLTRSMVHGALLFVFVETACAIPSWGHSAAALAVGALVGAVWHAISANRFRCVVTCIVPYAALRLAFRSNSPTSDAVFGVLGFVMLCGLAALVGFLREQRRAEDLDY